MRFAIFLFAINYYAIIRFSKKKYFSSDMVIDNAEYSKNSLKKYVRTGNKICTEKKQAILATIVL